MLVVDASEESDDVDEEAPVSSGTTGNSGVEDEELSEGVEDNWSSPSWLGDESGEAVVKL